MTSAQAYWTLRLNQHAVTLALTAPVNVIQLAATPYNAVGDTLPGRERIRYTTGDSTITVDSTGLVTAKYTSASTPSYVVASLSDASQQVTITDTCYVLVTATAPTAPLDSFSIQPAPGDSAKRPVFTAFYLSKRIVDRTGGSMDNVLSYFTSSDPTTSTVMDRLTGFASASRVGSVTFYAETWAYGVAKKDSLVFTISVPTQQEITVLSQTPTGSTSPILTFWPSVATVGVGAVVTWVNRSFTDSIDVEFDNPTHVDSVLFSQVYQFYTGSGNIAPWLADTLPGPGSSAIDLAGYRAYLNYWGNPADAEYFWYGRAGRRQRQFPVAGVYHYHSRLWNTEGSIRVE